MAYKAFAVYPNSGSFTIPASKYGGTSFYSKTASTLVSGVSDWQATILESTEEPIEFQIKGRQGSSSGLAIGGDTNTGGPVLNGVQIVPVIEFLQPDVTVSSPPLEYGPLPQGTYALVHVHGSVDLGGSQPRYTGGWYRLVHSTASTAINERVNYPEKGRYLTGDVSSLNYSGSTHIFNHGGGFITLAFNDIPENYADNNANTLATNVTTYAKEGLAYGIAAGANITEPLSPIFALIDIKSLNSPDGLTAPVLFAPAEGNIIGTTPLDVYLFNTTPNSRIFYTVSDSADVAPPFPAIDIHGNAGANTSEYDPDAHIQLIGDCQISAIATSPGLPPSPMTTAFYGFASAQAAASAPPLSAPNTPTNFHISGVADQTIGLAWNGVTGATSYILTRSEALNGNYYTLAYVGGTAYVDVGTHSGTILGGDYTNITKPYNGVPYFYKVIAVNAAGSSPPTAAITATAVQAPAPPDVPSMSITIAPTTLTLAMTPGSNLAASLTTYYVVYYIPLSPSMGQSAQDAFNALSGSSDHQKFVTALGTSVIMTGHAGVPAGATTDSTLAIASNILPTSYTITSLTNAQLYAVMLGAGNENVVGTPTTSAVQFVTPYANPTPYTVDGSHLTADLGYSKINLAWIQDTAQETTAGPLYYQAYEYTASSGGSPIDASGWYYTSSSMSRVFSSLVLATPYYYSISLLGQNNTASVTADQPTRLDFTTLAAPSVGGSLSANATGAAGTTGSAGNGQIPITGTLSPTFASGYSISSFVLYRKITRSGTIIQDFTDVTGSLVSPSYTSGLLTSATDIAPFMDADYTYRAAVYLNNTTTALNGDYAVLKDSTLSSMGIAVPALSGNSSGFTVTTFNGADTFKVYHKTSGTVTTGDTATSFTAGTTSLTIPYTSISGHRSLKVACVVGGVEGNLSAQFNFAYPPVVSSISPNTQVHGTALPASLTITGTNFVTGAHMVFSIPNGFFGYNDYNVTATFVNSTSLTVSTPFAGLLSDPTNSAEIGIPYIVSVVNPDTQSSNRDKTYIIT